MGSFLQKIPWDKLIGIPAYQRWLGIGVVCLLMVVLSYFLVFKSQQDAINVLKEELSKKENEFRTNQSYANRINELQAKVDKLNEDLARAKKRLPEEREIPDLLKQVSDLATTAGLEVVTFKPKTEEPKDFYSEVPVQVRVTGRFHNTLAFFDEVSRLPRIVTISNIDMKKVTTPTKDVVLQTNCNATTYRFLEEEARKTGEKKEKKDKGGKGEKPKKGGSDKNE